MLLVLFYIFYENIVFQRTTLPKNHRFEFDTPHEEFFVNTTGGDSLNVLRFKTDRAARGMVFYLHGNADNLTRWGTYAVDFTRLGYDVVMFDYRGYGKSSGTPNDQNIYADAWTIFEWVESHFDYPNIVFYGRSLGSAVASRLATTQDPDLLILETPFARFGDVIWPLMPALSIFPINADFSNLDNVKKIECRKAIFHGTNDWVVPLSSALKLKPLLGPSDEFIVIEGGGHKNLREFQSYHEHLEAILN